MGVCADPARRARRRRAGPGRRWAASAGPCWRGPAGTGRPASGPGRRWAWRAPAWRARSARRSARTAPARRGRRDGAPAGPAAPRRRAPGCPPPGGRANTARSSRNASPGGADAAPPSAAVITNAAARACCAPASSTISVASSARGQLHGLARLRAGPVGEIAAQHGHAQGAVRGQRRQRGFGRILGAGPVSRVGALQRVVDRGQARRVGREGPR